MPKPFLCCLAAVSLALPFTASGHMLQSDGSIGAVLHIDPADDPAAGEAAYFFFAFKDKQNKFKPADCDCTALVLQDNKQIYSQPLFENNPAPSLTNASFSYIFPAPNIYQVRITGQPVAPEGFQPFTLTYDIRVSRQAAASPSPPSDNQQFSPWIAHHILHVIATGIITLTVLAMIIYEKISRP